MVSFWGFYVATTSMTAYLLFNNIWKKKKKQVSCFIACLSFALAKIYIFQRNNLQYFLRFFVYEQIANIFFFIEGHDIISHTCLIQKKIHNKIIANAKQKKNLFENIIINYIVRKGREKTTKLNNWNVIINNL